VEAVTLHLGRDGQGPTLQVTASFGVAALRKEDLTLFNTLSRADKALYRAKSQGRNRVECEPAEEDADAYARHSRS
jgi:diguanylate cyclase (GGDEF)-like protein